MNDIIEVGKETKKHNIVKYSMPLFIFYYIYKKKNVIIVCIWLLSTTVTKNCNKNNLEIPCGLYAYCKLISINIIYYELSNSSIGTYNVYIVKTKRL